MAYALAILAAVAFAFGTVLQQKGTLQTSSGENDPRFLVEILHKPVWLAGMTAQAAGWILQAAALDRGPLVVVQCLTAMSLVIALPLGIWLTRQHLGGREWLGALAVLVGIMFFLWAGAPSGGTSHPSASVWWGACLGTLFLVAVLAAFGTRMEGASKALLFGSAAGFGYGLQAAVTKTFVGELGHGALSLLADWSVYVLVDLGRRRVRPPAGGAQDRRARSGHGVEQRRDALLQCDLGDRRLRRKARGERRRPCRLGGRRA